MAKRLRFYDVRYSAMPALAGMCQDNNRDLAELVNSAQRRLLYAPQAGNEGWWGSWAEIAFEVTRAKPYITLNREIARLEAVMVCDHVIPVNNQFFEYLQFGNGRMPKTCRACDGWHLPQVFTRNNAVTSVCLSNPPQWIRVYVTDPADVSNPSLARVLLQGQDEFGNTIYSQDGFYRVTGVFLDFASPFVQSPFTFKTLTGIQKDKTNGAIRIAQADPTTGEEIDLLTMEPGEMVADYRRYYLDKLPCFCCPPPGGTGCTVDSDEPVTIRAIAKLDLVPVTADTDYLLIQNKEAIILGCQSVYHSRCDDSASKLMAKDEFRQAIQLLNGELNHYLGSEQPAIGFAPFGSARLSRQRIGQLI